MLPYGAVDCVDVIIVVEKPILHQGSGSDEGILAPSLIGRASAHALACSPGAGRHARPDAAGVPSHGQPARRHVGNRWIGQNLPC
jgi:hypothetical protein